MSSDKDNSYENLFIFTSGGVTMVFMDKIEFIYSLYLLESCGYK
jgi:hypothetical protein